MYMYVNVCNVIAFIGPVTQNLHKYVLRYMFLHFKKILFYNFDDSDGLEHWENVGITFQISNNLKLLNKTISLQNSIHFLTTDQSNCTWDNVTHIFYFIKFAELFWVIYTVYTGMFHGNWNDFSKSERAKKKKYPWVPCTLFPLLITSKRSAGDYNWKLWHTCRQG